MGARTEEATFTFSGVDWETPFQGPFFKVVEVLLDRPKDSLVKSDQKTLKSVFTASLFDVEH